MSSTSTNDPICTMLAARRLQALTNVPPIRMNLVNSPYAIGYKQKELDMRRKVEILAYNGNGQNTKTNKQTKSERWSQLAKGFYRSSSFYNPVDASGHFKQPSDCPNDDKIHVPSYRSGIPGPVEYLWLDDTVPLYNYKTTIDAYALLNSQNTVEWNVWTSYDIACPSSTSTPIFSFVINPAIQKTSYQFGFTMPIVLDISGSNVSNNFSIGTITSTNFAVSVYYQGQQVPFTTTPIVTTFSQDMSYSITPTSIAPFRFQSYLGVLQVSSIQLPTQPSFIYTIQLDFIPPTQILQQNKYSYTCVCNSSNVSLPLSIPIIRSNCSVTSQILNTNQTTIPTFAFSGV
jgi:hypothetical protein